jgi:DNA polymerase III subunit gamma/tau
MEILSEVVPTLKWATNKKLHLELAVIRAIQSLAEVGFDEVLDALEGLRQGPANPRPAGKSATAPPVIHAARTLETPGTSGNVKAEPEREPAKHAVVTKEKPIVAAATTPEAPVAEAVPEAVKPSSVSSETIKDETVGTSSRSSEELGAQTLETKTDEHELIPTEPDLNQLWIDIVTEVRKSRPLIQQYFTVAVPVSLLQNELRLGFGSQHGMAMETLLRPNNRKYIEQLLTERLGKPTNIRGETRDDLAPIVFPEKNEPATNPETDFKNDPLIQKALEIFQAEIQAAD